MPQCYRSEAIIAGIILKKSESRSAPSHSFCRCTRFWRGAAVNRRRGCCACRASNCRRRARFSRTRSSRERKALTNQPRKCRSDTIMVRILSEKSESSSSPSHSFCRCTTFWRDTGVFGMHNSQRKRGVTARRNLRSMVLALDPNSRAAL